MGNWNNSSDSSSGNGNNRHSHIDGMLPGVILICVVVGAVGLYKQVVKDYKKGQEISKKTALLNQEKKQLMEALESAGRRRLGENEKAVSVARKAWPSPYATYLGELVPTIENSTLAAIPLRSVDAFYGEAERDNPYSGDAMSLAIEDLKRSRGKSVRAQLWASACLADPRCLNRVLEVSDAPGILLQSQQELAKSLVQKNQANSLAVCHSLGTTYRDLAYYGFPGVDFTDAARTEVSCANKPGYQDYKPFGIPVLQHVKMAATALKAYSDGRGG